MEGAFDLFKCVFIAYSGIESGLANEDVIGPEGLFAGFFAVVDDFLLATGGFTDVALSHLHAGVLGVKIEAVDDEKEEQDSCVWEGFAG
ncbi:MAG: hypothetical protein DA446_08740 [Bacteroidetes bacterium]|nr:MAG: hypothetical protein DA446_08740 [Bacteroidota bacterium]